MYKSQYKQGATTLRIWICLIIVLFSFSSSVSGQGSLDVSANNAVLMDHSTGKVLFEKKCT